jgi:hypothetical protein
MPTQPCVVIYGNTLALAGIAIAIQDRPEMRVVSMQVGGPGDAEALEALHPDVILFDQGQAGVQPYLTQLKHHAELYLIGVDANNNQMSVWSGRQMGAATIQDLLEMIGKLSGSSPE